jgi:hypothetical protein
MTVKQYLQGAINYMKATLRPTASIEIAEDRYSKCLQCDKRATFPREKCSLCNCYLPQKTLLVDQHCPIGRW